MFYLSLNNVLLIFSPPTCVYWNSIVARSISHGQFWILLFIFIHSLWESYHHGVYLFFVLSSFRALTLDHSLYSKLPFNQKGQQFISDNTVSLFFCFGFWATPDDTHGYSLLIHSGIRPGNAWGCHMGCQGFNMGLPQATKCFVCCTITPALIHLSLDVFINPFSGHPVPIPTPYHEGRITFSF